MEENIEIYPPDVGMYRVMEFMNLGFDVEQAGFLANSRVDLNTVQKAVQQGCSVQTAWDIFG